MSICFESYGRKKQTLNKKRCFKKFHKIHWKTPVLEPFLKQNC